MADPATTKTVAAAVASTGGTAAPGHAGPSHAGATGAGPARDGTGPSGPGCDLEALRTEIDHLDAEILRLVQRRTAASKAIGQARLAAGGPRVVYGREMAVLDRYRELGQEGQELAMLLLRLGRGRLGR